jgi:hypothetical protein
VFNFAGASSRYGLGAFYGQQVGASKANPPGVRQHEPKTHMRAFFVGTSLSVIGSI